MGRATNSRSRKQRHDPLLKDLDAAEGHLRKTKHKNTRKDEQEDDDATDFVDDKASRRILQLAKEQQDEIADDEEKQETALKSSMARFNVNYENPENDDDENPEQDISDFEPEQDIEAEEEEEELVQVDEEDAAMFDQYFRQSKDFNAFGGNYNLADKILASIREKEMESENGPNLGQSQEKDIQRPVMPREGVALPEKVIRAYTAVGTILKTWTHGKLPKLFKVLPSLRNWQDVMYVTNPEEWSPHAVFEATKLFVSNMGAAEAQQFVNIVLLDRFRENIETSTDHTLNYHIYRALKKSLYKPSAFFKGFLFPLVESGCNVREATIAASVLAKVSVPVLHSSAALSYLLRLPFSPATTVFIKVLLEKKYALPYQTVDECVYYFMRFRVLDDGSNGEDASRVLPVVWHKALLSFAQRYKNDITQDQRDFLLETVRQRGHNAIGPEIRKELLAGASREFVDKPEATDELMIDVK